MNTVRWGILSTAKIATEVVIPAMQKGKYSRVTAIASRSLQNAQRAATTLNIPKAYGDYAELLQDPDIDAIYIPLPNHLHVPWTLKGLKAGKNVLCEKPISLDADEAAQLLETARAYPKLKVMEAFMYRHHPQWQKAKTMVQKGSIGEVETVHSFFSYYNVDPKDIRNQADIGGGGLMDIGCYCISLSRWIFDSEPERVVGEMVFDPAFNTDRLTTGILDFNPGIATFTCGTQLAPCQQVNIVGTRGRIEIDQPFNPAPDQSTTLQVQQDGNTRQITLHPVNQYTIQGDLLSKAILDDAPVPTPLEDAMQNMKVIDHLVHSAKTQAWI